MICAADVEAAQRLVIALHIAMCGGDVERVAALGRATVLVADLALVLGIEGPWCVRCARKIEAAP